MIAALLKAIKDRCAFIPDLDGVEIQVAMNARFDSLVEGKLNACVAPIAVEYDYATRDIVRETTTVALCVAEYFADKFDENDVYGLLKVIPAINQAFFGVNLPVPNGLYKWDTTYALGVPFNNMVKDVPGGLLDVGAADNEYVYQAPIVMRYVRDLGYSKSTVIRLHDYTDDVSDIRSAEKLRMSLYIYDQEDAEVTAELYKSGLLQFE